MGRSGLAFITIPVALASSGSGCQEAANGALGDVAVAVGEVPAIQAHVDPTSTVAAVPAAATLPSDTVRQIRRIGGEEEFGYIGVMRYHHDFLFIGDSYVAPHVVLVDLAEGKVVDRVGTNGEGPGEFRNPGGISPAFDMPTPAVWVHDFYNRRMTLVEVGAQRELRVARFVPLRVATSTEHPVRLGDRIASVGLFGAAAVLMFFDLEGAPTTRTGTPPFSRQDMPHPTGIRLVNRANLAVRPSADRLAVGFYSANRIDIYDAEGAKIASTSGPREVTASFYIEDDKFFWTEEENQLAYTSIAASNDEVFALFCGCTMGKEEATDRTRVHVFSWSGSFRRELILPVPATRIEVSRDGRRLYGAVEDPWPVIVEWSIPQGGNNGN